MSLDVYQQSLANKYIIIKKSTTGDVENINLNEEAVLQHVSNFGFFVLLANKNSLTEDVLQIYRNKDIIEKAFENLKDRLDVTRTEVHSDLAFNNKIFLCYIALIYISCIEKKVKEHDLFKNYTLNKIIDALGIIKINLIDVFENKYSEITKKQKELFEKLGVPPLA